MISPKTILLAIGFTAGPTVFAQTFDWDCTNSPQTCNNACYYLNCRGTNTETYTYDPNNSNQQMINSGCSQNPCNNDDLPFGSFGDTCDEFPFESVQEGGTGAQLRCVDMSDNASQGGQLGNFYKTINPGDQFQASISNYGNSPYCGDGNMCTNDGGEFWLQNGNFVTDRRRSSRVMPRVSSPSFELSSGTAKSPFRKFLGEDGVERLWLSHNKNGTLVGKKVWSQEKGDVTIVKEILD